VGEEIPLEARIVACCDAWNAMRTDRVYRNALAHDVAIAELLSNSGSQFDPRVVDALVEIVEPAGRREIAAGEPAARRRQHAAPDMLHVSVDR
jgi:HD-GYP domain-containing protein (c-di-GMP phosphodiesterase class II)